METTLPYNFTRRSKSYMDWLLYTIKSEKYLLQENLSENWENVE